MPADDPRNTDPLLADLVQEAPEPEHMTRMMDGVRCRYDRSQRRRNRLRHTSIGGAMVVAVAALLLLVPVTYDVSVGVRVTADWPLSAAVTDLIEADLANLDGLVGRKTDFSGDLVRGTFIFRGPESASVVVAVEEVLARHLPTDISSAVQATEMTRRMGGNAIAAMNHAYFRINTKGLSNEEIELAIIEELGLMGASGVDANVTEFPDGERRIDVQINSCPVDSFTFEVSF